MAGNEFFNLKPTIWDNRLIVALKRRLIFGNLTNNKYTGQVTQGGSVKISQIGEVATGAYTAYSDMDHETLDDAQLTMLIDQQYYFAFQLDVTDTRFIPVDVMGGGIDRGTYKIRNRIDQFIAAKYTDAGITHGSATTPKQASSGNIVQHLAEFYETISEADVPDEGRWATVKPWVMTKLFLAGVADKVPNSDVFVNGFLSGIAGFTRLHVSNNVQMSNTTTTTVMSSIDTEAIAYAGAMDGAIRILPVEARRGTNVDGLWIYGSKVVRPDMLATMYISEVAN